MKKRTRDCPRCRYGPSTADDFYCPNCGLFFPNGALEEVEGKMEEEEQDLVYDSHEKCNNEPYIEWATQ